MVIDDKSYSLTSKNFIPIETPKKHIIIGNTFNHDMQHVIGWKTRFNGLCKKTAAYTISKDGKIFQHFNPKFFGKSLVNESLNTKSIVILLENDGWLLKDSEKNQFITWLGDIYNGDEIFEKRWRGIEYWCPYTEAQVESAIYLTKKLCAEFKIPFSTPTHNTKIDKLVNYQGVLYKSNLERYYTDVNPSWDFIRFKNEIENNE